MSRRTGCMVVLTTETLEQIVAQGGTQHWPLSDWRADHNDYVLCVRNAHHEDSPGDGIPHGQAFLVGKLDRFVPSGVEKRKRIVLSEWAPVAIPDCWQRDRFPVRYRNLSEFPIDPASVDFRPMAGVQGPQVADTEISGQTSIAELLRQAKVLAAGHLGLPTSMVDVTIRA